MPRRRGALFLPLDTRFFEDAKILEAGEAAGWLYLDIACRAKSMETDGELTLAQVERLGVKGWQRRLEALVKHGLVTVTDGRVFINAWLNHNDPMSSVKQHRDNDAKRKRELSKIREAIYARDGRACVYCRATTDLCIDHVKPTSLGGPHDESNLQTLCKSCNSRKGRRDATGLSLDDVRRLYGIPVLFPLESRDLPVTEVEVEVEKFPPNPPETGGNPTNPRALGTNPRGPKAASAADLWLAGRTGTDA